MFLDFFTPNIEDKTDVIEKNSLESEIKNITYMLNYLRDISQRDALMYVLQDEGFKLMRVSRFVFTTLEPQAILDALEKHNVKEFTLETISDLKNAF